METFAEKLKKARSRKKLMSRHVAAAIGIDAALYSRFESARRIPTRNQVLQMAAIFDLDAKALLVPWMSSRLLAELENEPFALEALRLAESEFEYRGKPRKSSVPKELGGLLKKADLLKKKLHDLRHLDSYRIAEALAIEYTWQSNKIEGNTLTLRETELVVNKGLTISGKSMREHLEAINHTDAIAFIREMAENKLQLSESRILQIHALVLRGIDRDYAGKYRNMQVSISGSEFLPPAPYLVPKKMEELMEWYGINKSSLHPILLAAEMHERLVTIHPFIDGNGRTSRLLMNLILIQNGYTIANIKGDQKSRSAYYHTLETAQVKGKRDVFLKLMVETEIAGLNWYLRVLGG